MTANGKQPDWPYWWGPYPMMGPPLLPPGTPIPPAPAPPGAQRLPAPWVQPLPPPPSPFPPARQYLEDVADWEGREMQAEEARIGVWEE